ncbi:MAG: enoyl-CoA hydratase-related protein [Hyphomonas sp.]
MSDESTVLTRDVDGVRVITLNRPDRLNALNDSIMAPLAVAVVEAAEDETIGCVVVTGAGRGFCSGGDLKGNRAKLEVTPNVGGPTEQSHLRLRSHMETSRVLHEMGKPTIAMINGPVAGAGIGIAGACDLRFAGQSATFLSAFDRIGGSGDFGSTWFWTQILGTAKARELFFLGEKFDAEAALKFGLYTRLFSDAELEAETMSVAKRLAAGPRMGWRYMKANLNNAEDGVFEQHLDQESLYMGLSTQAAGRIFKAMKAQSES